MDPSWFAAVDIYCERTSAAFWAEPVNAVTNLAFLIAAAAGFAHWRAAGGRDWPVLVLIGIVALVGIGSFLFHTFATRIAALADVLPIAAFIYGYLWLALMRFLRVPLWAALAVLAGFAVLSYALPVLTPEVLRHGSINYVPALCALLAIGWLTRREATGRRLLAAAAVFLVSLTLRTVDVAACEAFPLGTHFAWHVLNGLMLYLLLRAAIMAGRTPARARSLT